MSPLGWQWTVEVIAVFAAYAAAVCLWAAACKRFARRAAGRRARQERRASLAPVIVLRPPGAAPVAPADRRTPRRVAR